MGERGDMRLLGRAINNRWLTDEHKPAAMAAIEAGLKSADDRVRQSALRNLIAMESQNQKDEHQQANEFISRVIELANRLGIDVGVGTGGQAAEVRAIEDDGSTAEAEEERT